MARPAHPEPKVFLSDELTSRGLDWYRETFFSHATSERLLGEKSTSYLDVPSSAARAAAVLGRAEIVAQLRDPIERAVSNWRFSTEHGLEDRGLEEALEDGLEGPRAWDPSVSSVSPFAYLERGRYADHLEPWFSSFGDSVHVTFLDEVAVQPGAIGELYAVLGVDPRHRPGRPGSVVNDSGRAVPEIGNRLRAQLRAYYRDGDDRLQARLGRPLPWRSDSVKPAETGG